TERAIQTALRLLALDPLQESAHRALMRLYARQGRRASALRQYQVCVGVLQRELGVEPEPQTRQVYRDLLRERSGSAERPEAPARTVGRGGLLATADAATAELEPLVGRRGELARLVSALDAAHAGRGAAAVVVGEAGVGKTRLVDALSTSARQKGWRVVG